MKSPLAAIGGLFVGFGATAAGLRPSTPPPPPACVWPADAGPAIQLRTGLRRDPLRVCWQSEAPSHNVSAEECITDSALHQLEVGMPVAEPTIALVGNKMQLLDGGPVFDFAVSWTDRDGPLRVCAHIRNQVTGYSNPDICKSRDELLGLIEGHELHATPTPRRSGGRL